MGRKIKDEIDGIVAELFDDYKNGRIIDKMEMFTQPDRDEVMEIVQGLKKIVYPGYFIDRSKKIYNLNYNVAVQIEDIMYNLNKQIAIALRFRPELNECPDCDLNSMAEDISVEFFKRLPKIREYLATDVEATFDGDPAAYSFEEIILSYPGLLAITIYRLAHELYVLNVPLIPRIMTEYAHSRTGIDIHPGATIGKYFFIDHGTGIVVGETTIIGEHVKVYQGVTIGALSTKGGQRLKSVKRHPTIEDNVTIYSGASLLGGETVIGEGAVIGGNAFITMPVAPGTRVSIKNQELQLKNGDGKKSVESVDMEADENWFYVI